MRRCTPKLVKVALDYHAATVILAHNHPSGVSEPSAADRQMTNKIKRYAVGDIKVLDHIVVGQGECTSFAQRGFL